MRAAQAVSVVAIGLLGCGGDDGRPKGSEESAGPAPATSLATSAKGLVSVPSVPASVAGETRLDALRAAVTPLAVALLDRAGPRCPRSQPFAPTFDPGPSPAAGTTAMDDKAVVEVNVDCNVVAGGAGNASSFAIASFASLRGVVRDDLAGGWLSMFESGAAAPAPSAGALTWKTFCPSAYSADAHVTDLVARRALGTDGSYIELTLSIATPAFEGQGSLERRDHEVVTAAATAALAPYAADLDTVANGVEKVCASAHGERGPNVPLEGTKLASNPSIASIEAACLTRSDGGKALSLIPFRGPVAAHDVPLQMTGSTRALRGVVSLSSGSGVIELDLERTTEKGKLTVGLRAKAPR